MALSNRLKLLFSRHSDKSQADLARFAGVKPPSVNDWLSGKTKKMAGPTLIKVAVYFSVNPNWLATGAEPMEAGTATANITAPSPRMSASASQSNQPVSPVVIAQADTNSIVSALAVIQKHTQRLSILDPPSRDFVNGLLQDCIKRPELAAYLDTVIERTFLACTVKHRTPDHIRNGTTG